MFLVTNTIVTSFRHSHLATEGYCIVMQNVRVVLGAQLSILYFCLLPLKIVLKMCSATEKNPTNLSKY